MQYRAVTRRGTLVFGAVEFTTTPRLYELSPEEAAILQKLYGQRLVLELLEPQPVASEGGPGRTAGGRGGRRSVAAELDAEPDQEPEDAEKGEES